VTQLDHAFGQLMTALDEMKLADNTFVVFTADNGPEGDGIKTPGRGSTGGLRGRKRDVYEGGIRVPGIVRWPGAVRAGSISDVPVIGTDVFVTVAGIAGVQVPQDRVLDGGDFLPALTGRPVLRSRPLYWRCAIAKEPMKTAMRVDDWKILADEALTRFEIYDLREDPLEQHNRSTDEPGRLETLQQSLMQLNSEIEAEGPNWWKDYDHSGRPKP
jgi:arylsulfatase A